MHEHKLARMQYNNKIRPLNQQGATIGFRDEAWKYLWSRRKKMKYPPRTPFEEQGVDRVQVRRVISRSNPIKVMFMGVVFPPNPEHNFDAKMTIKRGSKIRQLLRGTYRMTKFHHNYNVNQLLIAGDWRQVYDNDMNTRNEILALIVNYYELDGDIAQALCLRYNTHERG
jgi:hypothetical protein